MTRRAFHLLFAALLLALPALALTVARIGAMALADWRDKE